MTNERTRIFDGVKEHKHENREYWHPMSRIHAEEVKVKPKTDEESIHNTILYLQGVLHELEEKKIDISTVITQANKKLNEIKIEEELHSTEIFRLKILLGD